MRKHVLSMLFSSPKFLKIVRPVYVIKQRRAKESSLCRSKGFILLLHCFQRINVPSLLSEPFQGASNVFCESECQNI